MLNVVNFGAGSYVLYAEVQEDGMIEVDPEAYGDSFARPARLLPVEAKALVAAIDLIGEHIPEGSLASVREKVVAALGEDPIREGLQVATRGRRRLAGRGDRLARDRRPAAARDRVLQGERGRVLQAHGRAVRADQRARGLVRRLLRPGEGGRAPLPPRPHQGRDGHATSASSRAPRSTRPPTSTAGRAPARCPPRAARALWISPERARWAREERTVVEELADGALIVELSFAGVDWLVREVLKEAGDAAVLEPEDAREAVLEAAAHLAAA